MSAQTVIEKKTAAVITPVYIAIEKDMVPCTVFAIGLTLVEVISLYISDDGGETGEIIQQNAANVELAVDNNTITIDSPMRLGVTKPVTASPAGVFLSYQKEV